MRDSKLGPVGAKALGKRSNLNYVGRSNNYLFYSRWFYVNILQRFIHGVNNVLSF